MRKDCFVHFQMVGVWLVMPRVLSSGRQYFPTIVYKVGQ